MPKQRNMSVDQLVNPSPRQLEFIDAVRNYDFVLYGGAAGGGKSYILRWGLVWTLLSYALVLNLKNVVVGLFCEDYPSLSDRQINKIRTEFPPWLGTLKLQSENRHYQLAPQYGGGIIALRNLDDVSKYQSSEFGAIAVDELTKNDVTVFDYLRLRLRWPGIDHPKFMAGTNPGGKGHAWVKAYWIDRKFPPELRSLAPQFKHVPAKATDNPHLPQSYWEQLQTLPKAMREAFAEGRWDIFAGQYFDIFDPSNNGRHVRPPHELGLEVWHPRWVSVDWGFAHPAAVYWHGQRDDGVTVTYREKVEANLSPAMLAQKIMDLSTNMLMDGEGKPTGRHESSLITHVYMGPDAWAKRTDADSVADQMNRIFRQNGFPLCTQASNDRIGGWTLMYDMLRDNRWLIGANCTGLIECLPTLVRDEKRLEDCVKIDATPTMPGDDCADSARYGLYSRLRPSQPPLESRIAQRVMEIPDQHARMMHLHRIEHEEKQKSLISGPQRKHWSASRWARSV